MVEEGMFCMPNDVAKRRLLAVQFVKNADFKKLQSIQADSRIYKDH